MNRLLKDILRALAVRTLARHHPTIVAICGSVGKTSTRRAVAAVLKRSFSARESSKNFNNEIGVPLAVLGEKETGGRSPFAWLAILIRGVRTAYGSGGTYPELLVLEMATDHPGDLKYLTGLARPDVVVMTAVSEERTEFLGDLDGVAAEEGTAVEAVPEGGSVILNADDGRVLAMAARTKARVLTFGFSPKADLKARAIETESAMGTYFTRFEIWSTGGRSLPVTLSGAIGDGNVYAALAAAAVAKALGVSDELIPYGLAEYQPPPGRLRLLAGRGGAFIIDDTYNSSPRAAELALKTLAGLSAGQTGRKMAVLGDMLELGEMTEESHRRVGTAAAASGLDLLVCVGPKSRTLCQEAVKNGMHEKSVLHFGSAEEAGHFLHDKITSGDRLLIKGSRGMRMEKAVKILMADPSLY